MWLDLIQPQKTLNPELRFILISRPAFEGRCPRQGGNTCSHPEHRSKAPSQPWYCRVSRWKSRSVPTLDDGFCKIINLPTFAEVVKLVDTPDSKSGASNRVPVRVRLSAPLIFSPQFLPRLILQFFLQIIELPEMNQAVWFSHSRQVILLDSKIHEDRVFRTSRSSWHYG